MKNFVVTEVPANCASDYPDANFLRVVNTLEASQRLAERHRDEFNIPVVGITGSNGKTMVKEWLYQLLSPQMCATRSPRSYNSQIGVPLSVWLMNEQTEVGVFEAGISRPGEMLALRDIIQPTIAVLTNIGEAHQRNFESKGDKCKEKLVLFHEARTVVYNADDELVERVLAQMESTLPGGEPQERLGWSVRDRHAPMFVKSIEKKESATTVTHIYKGGEENWYSIPFIDDASICNSIICAIVALRIGIAPDELDRRMQGIEQVAMRLEVKEGQHGCTLINDSYDSDINSLDIALDFRTVAPTTRDADTHLS